MLERGLRRLAALNRSWTALRPRASGVGDLRFDAPALLRRRLVQSSASGRRGGASRMKLSRVVLGSAVAVSLVGGGLMSMPAAAQDECGVSIYGGDVLNETVIDINAN